MLVYSIALLLILLLGLSFYSSGLYKRDREKAKKSYVFVICIVLILISGMRNVAVGEDTYAYFLTFNDVKGISWGQTFNEIADYYQKGVGKDPGYTLFQKVLQIISTNYTIFLVLTAAIFYIALGNFINRNTVKLSDTMVSFTIFFVLFFNVFSITAIRQSIALAAAMYSYEFIKRKIILPFLIVIILASTIHRSVLVFIPFYFICQLKNTKYLYTIVLLLFPIFLLQKDFLAKYFISLGGYDEYETFDGAGTYVFTSIFVLISLVALIRRKNILKRNPQFQNYYNAFSFALVLLPLSWVHPALLRITMYFSIFMLLFIPEIIHSFLTISKKIKTDLTIITIILLIVLFIKSNWHSPPYGFFWEEMRLGKNYFEDK